jgi:KUP system potassium uptake protein
LYNQSEAKQKRLADVVEELTEHPVQRAPGTAVFLTNNAEYAPQSLLANLKHNHVLHEHTIIVSVLTADVPHVSVADHAQVENIAPGWTKITLTFGFMDTPNIPLAMADLRHDQKLEFRVMSTSFFLSKRTILPSKDLRMPLWRDHIYVALTKVATNAADYFQIPRDRAIEVGEKLWL